MPWQWCGCACGGYVLRLGQFCLWKEYTGQDEWSLYSSHAAEVKGTGLGTRSPSECDRIAAKYLRERLAEIETDLDRQQRELGIARDLLQKLTKQ